MENSLGKIVKDVMRTHDQKMELIYCFNLVNYKCKLERFNRICKKRKWPEKLEIVQIA